MPLKNDIEVCVQLCVDYEIMCRITETALTLTMNIQYAKLFKRKVQVCSGEMQFNYQYSSVCKLPIRNYFSVYPMMSYTKQ